MTFLCCRIYDLTRVAYNDMPRLDVVVHVDPDDDFHLPVPSHGGKMRIAPTYLNLPSSLHPFEAALTALVRVHSSQLLLNYPSIFTLSRFLC